MKRRFLGRLGIWAAVAVAGVIVLLTVNYCTAENSRSQPTGKTGTSTGKAMGTEGSATATRPAPIIIWYHNGPRDKPATLKRVLASGLATHVMIYGRHRADMKLQGNRNIHQAIELVKKSKLKLIWSRNLWPYYNLRDFRLEQFFDPNYYVREIDTMRAEAAKMGAEMCALDTEAYGYSPTKTYLRGHNKLDRIQRNRLERTITQVIKKVGKVEFVYPGGNRNPTHPYNVLARLGKNRISEDTYYANEGRLKQIKYEYEIFGAYLNTVSRNRQYSHLPYFLVEEIFQKSHLWSGKKGVFLYPKEDKADAVANRLADFSKTINGKKAGWKQ